MYDALIVGGGPAGLSAALVLGRACRHVLLCDAGNPRNASSRGVHGFLTRDGVTPTELRRIARRQLEAYPNVELVHDEVVGASKHGEAFDLTLGSGGHVRGRRLLLATGVTDELPPIDGLRPLWGRLAFPCPYCDGWDFRGGRLGAYGPLDSVTSLARALTGWSRHVVMVTDGTETDAARESVASRLGSPNLRVVSGPIRRLEENDDGSLTIVFETTSLRMDALFLDTPQRQQAPLVASFGCAVDERGRALTNDLESTNVPGLFVAGDASASVELAIVAAAEGATAAFAINRSLVRDAFEQGETLASTPAALAAISSPVR